MIRQYFVALSSLGALLVLAPALAVAQGPAPQTPWGHPDLQGTYTNKTTTPLQRPEELADSPAADYAKADELGYKP